MSRGLVGADGEHIDVFIGPCPESDVVYVIDQLTEGGRFDEHKCVLGTYTRDEAKQLYLENYPKGWRCGEVTAMTIDQFKAWLEKGDTTKPVCDQVSKFTSAAYRHLLAADLERIAACS